MFCRLQCLAGQFQLISLRLQARSVVIRKSFLLLFSKKEVLAFGFL
jgi:hypothetical protein